MVGGGGRDGEQNLRNQRGPERNNARKVENLIEAFEHEGLIEISGSFGGGGKGFMDGPIYH